jgi:hypothetical protein
MTTPLFPSVIGWNLLDGGTDAQDGNNYPGPALQDYAAGRAELQQQGSDILMDGYIHPTGLDAYSKWGGAETASMHLHLLDEINRGYFA